MKTRSLFAANTTVTVGASKDDLDQLMRRYGCTGKAVLEDNSMVAIIFHSHGRRVRFMFKEVGKQDFPGQPKRGKRLDPKKWAEQETRRLWRLEIMTIQVCLEQVEAGKDFDVVFAGYIVDPRSGRTLGELLKPGLDQLYLPGALGDIMQIAAQAGPSGK